MRRLMQTATILALTMSATAHAQLTKAEAGRAELGKCYSAEQTVADNAVIAWVELSWDNWRFYDQSLPNSHRLLEELSRLPQPQLL